MKRGSTHYNQHVCLYWTVQQSIFSYLSGYTSAMEFRRLSLESLRRHDFQCSPRFTCIMCSFNEIRHLRNILMMLVCIWFPWEIGVWICAQNCLTTNYEMSSVRKPHAMNIFPQKQKRVEWLYTCYQCHHIPLQYDIVFGAFSKISLFWQRAEQWQS